MEAEEYLSWVPFPCAEALWLYIKVGKRHGDDQEPSVLYSRSIFCIPPLRCKHAVAARIAKAHHSAGGWVISSWARTSWPTLRLLTGWHRSGYPKGAQLYTTGLVRKAWLAIHPTSSSWLTIVNHVDLYYRGRQTIWAQSKVASLERLHYTSDSHHSISLQRDQSIILQEG